MTKTKGTKEWADTNINIIQGCSNNCRYCYAKQMAIRFKRKTEESWPIMEIDWSKVNRGYRKRKGRIMFPTSHDITGNDGEVSACILTLRRLLLPGNEVLITTKPRLSVTKAICHELQAFKNQIKFRFTITSMNNETLKYWEPEAPSYEERFESLRYAANEGYKCSISMEPFLDKDPMLLYWTTYPYIESFWIGPMNRYKNDLQIYSKEHLQRIHAVLKFQDKIRFKDAFLNKMSN